MKVQTHPKDNSIATFSDDDDYRYTLRRDLKDRCFMAKAKPQRMVTFVLLNPSTADAFKNDPTVGRCINHAKRWDFDIITITNLFAFRSPYPADLKDRKRGRRGADFENDVAITKACKESQMAIAGWGLHGALDNRDVEICALLKREGVKLHTLGFTQDRFPKHPMARGKAFVASDVKPQPWSYDDQAMFFRAREGK